MIKRKRIFAGMLLIALFIQSTICIAATKSTNISVTSSGASIQNLNGSYSQLSAVVNKSTLHARVTNTTNTSRYVTVTVARYYDGKPDGTKKNSNGVVPGNGEKKTESISKGSGSNGRYQYYFTSIEYNSVSSNTGIADGLTIIATQNK